jgi:hypothetical protein
MKHNYQKFAQLCESILQEVSTASTILPGSAAANVLIKALHSKYSLPHDQPYQQTDNISWSTINDTRAGAWAIIKFANGVGAIKAIESKQGYVAVAVPDENLEVGFDQFSKGGDVMNFFKQLGLGKIQQLYVGRDTGELSTKQDKRRLLRLQKERFGTASVDTLLKRFRPLWLRAVEAAQADIKGMAVTMVQNNSYGKANGKLQRLSELQEIADAIESGDIDQEPRRYTNNPHKESLKKYVSSAIYLAASHFYPEETGDVTRSYGGLNVENFQGTNRLLTDIGRGDQKKLATVLGFFKRLLISGH